MKDEIQSLNVSDLDFEELERRIELGQLLLPTEIGFNNCQSNCERLVNPN